MADHGEVIPAVPSVQERTDLEQRVVEAEAELAVLREEIAETNRGVIALYAELEETAERLRNVSELKSRFLAYVSHEFRTPLAAVKSMTRILLDRLDGPLSDEQEKQVLYVQSAASELLELVNDQLDLAKLEAGRLTVSPDWFEMLDFFATLRGMFRPILMNDAVTLTFEAPDEMVRIYSDDKKLAQILRNFIANALKFTAKGEVRVRAVLHANDTVTFSVSDTGIGIPEESLAFVFSDFVQVDSPLQKRFRGTGLGLALCRKFAVLLGGDVDVRSTLGVGSTFSVTIPTTLDVDPSA